MINFDFTTNTIIQYAIPFSIVLTILTWIWHNFVIGANDKNPFKHAIVDLTSEKQFGSLTLFAGIGMILLFGTGLLMILIAPTLQFGLEGTIAISMSFMSLLIIPALQTLLGMMREDRLSWRILINPNFLLTAYLIILTELSFLNWIKEITTYTQFRFLIFMLLYSLLIIVISIPLGLPEKNEAGKRRLPQQWRWRSLIVIDPIFIILCTSILAKLTLDVISLVQSI